MESIEKIYKDLTNVDIRQQQAIWDERGKGYLGEFMVFRELYPNLTGTCKILMNLQIPTANGKTTEIDLLVIHETGLLVFEIKHYKGSIYGKVNEPTWTQYFRTTRNQKFGNPVLQNQYHIDAIRSRFPGIPVHSYVVFTNPECRLNVESHEPNLTICQLDELQSHIRTLNTQSPVFDIDRIESIFDELLPFSPCTEQTVAVDDAELPLSHYLNKVNSEYKIHLQTMESKVEQETKSLQQKRKRTTIIAVAICAAFLIACIFTCMQICTYAREQVHSAQSKMNALMQKFEQVEEYSNGDLLLAPDLLTAHDIVLESSRDLENTVNFACTLRWNGGNYAVSIGENTAIIVMLQDGSVREYTVFNSRYPYTSDYYFGNTQIKSFGMHADGSIAVHEFYDLDVSDISYIKLINLGIWTSRDGKLENIATDYEIEVYNSLALSE